MFKSPKAKEITVEVKTCRTNKDLCEIVRYALEDEDVTKVKQVYVNKVG